MGSSIKIDRILQGVGTYTEKKKPHQIADGFQ